MRLFFDARYIRTDFHDGISRFSHELAHAVFAAAGAARMAEDAVEVTFIVHDPAQLAFLPSGAPHVTLHAPTSVLEPFAARRLNSHRPDVVYSPMQTIGALGRRFALILTLHDTIYYRHRTPPRDLPWFVRLGWRLFHLSYAPQRATLNAADVVATVSETSKRQFADVKLTKREVVVLPNAPQRLADLAPAGAMPGAAKPQNIVYMGSFMPYKNVETLVRAMRWLPGRTLHLLSRISDARRAELEKLAPADARIVFHGGVTDAEYAAILADAGMLATVSLDEGYGLPIAEALELGVPAVVSDMPIFHEVGGGGALYVPPRDPRAFAEAVASLDDDDARAAVVAAGREHVSRFTWAESASRLLAASRRALALRSR
ncbi:glycosyltransferase [Microbacterium sp. cf332]|uniref:glycosyltransferase n=1 Tax=Microbacterium sp. cf332 TaxID=1761804 RepID=UPI000886DEE8|nr:glycosyltransferase [Microbacterium sp. cf332]SDQ65440.1 Glycosyltransferase involved in cell wall bisynthesis [Microbacterium sp. cf332]